MSDLIEQVAREIAKELYDRFVMGGWEPQDVHGWLSAALRELSAKLDTRWEDWRKQLLDAWAKDHRATMTALLEGGPSKAEETTNG